MALKVHDRLAAEYPDQVSALLASITLLTTAPPSAAKLIDVVSNATGGLLPHLASASVHLIEVDPALSHRYAIFQALLQSEGAPPALTEDGTVFGSASGLLHETVVGFDSYFSCLATSLSPDIWAVPAGRVGGLVLYVFGVLVQGQKSHPLDPIRLLSPGHGGSTSLPAIEIPPGAYSAAVKWWTGQLNRVFSYITEPANYIISGRFSPQMAFEKVLTLEQLFRNCQSIATNTRDQHARRIVMFNSLDSLPGLIAGMKWEVAASPARSEATLARLEEAIPDEIKPILIPRARAAIAALRSLEDGFFQKNMVTNGTIQLPNKNGLDTCVPLENAATEWLRVIRNSQHDFDKEQTPRDRVLLTAHDGHIPAAIADLAWLHLLNIMTFPERLFRGPRPHHQAATPHPKD
ncbi:hypothetical protein [Specibacter sp. RAF43]|uniref:hypothetical protein n=1 Tax=Specibacter sp. RAF43 TaxID=3233057 RepID=UPI003F9DA02A